MTERARSTSYRSTEYIAFDGRLPEHEVRRLKSDKQFNKRRDDDLLYHSCPFIYGSIALDTDPDNLTSWPRVYNHPGGRVRSFIFNIDGEE